MTEPNTKPDMTPVRVDAGARHCSCSGDAEPFGHPRIFLRFNGATFVDCYYCGRRHAKPAYFERSQAA